MYYQTFAWVHRNLVEHGSFRSTFEGTEQQQTAQTSLFEEGVLHAVDQNPGTSVLTPAIATDHLDHTFPNSWIGCSDSVARLLRFPD